MVQLKEICYLENQYLIMQLDTRFLAFLEATKNESLESKNCTAVCSDGAKEMIGKNSGLKVKLKDFMTHMECVQYFLNICD